MRKKKVFILQGEGNISEKNKVIRRTITVEDSLNKVINHLRGHLLKSRNIELDFTSAINMFAMLGYRKFMSDDYISEEDWGIIRDYILGRKELKTAAAFDQAQDEWLRHELPKLLAGASKK